MTPSLLYDKLGTALDAVTRFFKLLGDTLEMSQPLIQKAIQEAKEKQYEDSRRHRI